MPKNVSPSRLQNLFEYRCDLSNSIWTSIINKHQHNRRNAINIVCVGTSHIVKTSEIKKKAKCISESLEDILKRKFKILQKNIVSRAVVYVDNITNKFYSPKNSVEHITWISPDFYIDDSGDSDNDIIETLVRTEKRKKSKKRSRKKRRKTNKKHKKKRVI
jgi:alpha-galactosidase/6-phospho-beta-glucosidase family protein